MRTEHNVGVMETEHDLARQAEPDYGHVTFVTEQNITYIAGREGLTLRSESVRNVLGLPQTESGIEAAPGGQQPLYTNMGLAPRLLEVGLRPLTDRLGDVQRASVPEMKPRPPHLLRIGERA